MRELNWNRIIDSIYTDVVITNRDGLIVYANEGTNRLFGMIKDELIGLSVYDLENEGVFSPSITRLVLETKSKQTIMQHTNTGKKLLITGNFIYDENNEVEYIACYSQDITELEEMKRYVAKVEKELNKLQLELSAFKLKEEKNNRFVALSKKTTLILNQAEQVAPTDASIFITGETGVGKSYLANFIHKLSGRKGKLVEINCGSIPDNLLEAELFGYVAGAFTGASSKGKKGLVEEAEGGTLFLDEIGELPLNLQTKLLTLIQNKTFYRIGDTKPKSVDFRIITATNIDIERKLKEGLFRADLYFRLSVILLHLPSLSERPEDLFELIKVYMAHFNHKYEKEKELSKEALNNLMVYSWPGNVRELANIIERIIITTKEDVLENRHLPFKFLSANEEIVIGSSLPQLMEQYETSILKSAKEGGRSTTEIAALLGVSQPTIVRKLQKYKLSNSLN